MKYPGVIAVLALATSSATACSPNEREYETPKSMCGISVTPRLLTPLLPPGKRVQSDFSDPLVNHGALHCKLSVDGKEILITTQEWTEKEEDALSIGDLMPEMEAEDLKGTRDFQYSQNGAALRVNCATPRKPERDLFAITRIPGPQKPDVADVKAFAKNYSKGVQASKQCIGR